jgi:uncharacterized phiE125 gp8 family phage protein
MTCYLLAGPAVEAVSLEAAKAFLRLDTTDEDALVTTLVAAARLHVESATGLALITQSWRLVLDDWPVARMVRLPVGPLQSLTTISAYDAEGTITELAADGILFDKTANPPLLYLPAGFGAAPILRDRQGIEIDFAAGFGDGPDDVPAALRQAMLALVAFWFENRDSVIAAGTGTVVPGGFDAMLGPYRRVRL